MFPRVKTIDGKKRRYLVESYRNEQGKPRQRHIAYIDLWPEKDIARFIEMHRQYKEALANSKRPDVTKVYKQVAKNIATKLWEKIEIFEREMEIKLAPDRNRADGRRIDSGTGLRRHARQHVPPNLLSELKDRLSFSKLDGILKNFRSDANYYPNGKLRPDLRNVLRVEFELIFKLIDQLRAELQE